MTHCEDFGKKSFPNICPIFNQDYVWGDIAKGTTPKLDCPMKKVKKIYFFYFFTIDTQIFLQGSYTIKNAVIDLSFVSRLPMAGYTWIFTVQLLNDIPKKLHKKVVYCILEEVSITEYRGGKRVKSQIP